MDGSVISEGGEFLVDSLGPSRDLIVDDVDLFIFFLEHGEVFLLSSNLLAHLDDVLVLELLKWVDLFAVLGGLLGIHLKFIQS